MAHQHHGIRLSGEESLKPLDGTDVEVVGRLVEKKYVGFLKEDFGELNAHAPTSGEFACRAVEVLASETQSDECAFKFSLVVLASHHEEALVLVGEFLDESHVFL